MTRCDLTTPHRCSLGLHLPDLTRDPAEQTRAQRWLGGLLLLVLLFAAAAVPGRSRSRSAPDGLR